MSNTAPHDPLVIAGKTYRSRLLTGTGKFKDFEETRLATEAAGAPAGSGTVGGMG